MPALLMTSVTSPAARDGRRDVGRRVTSSRIGATPGSVTLVGSRAPA